MLGVIFNFNVLDEPYKNSDVKKGFDKLEAIAKKFGVETFYSLGKNRNVFFDYEFENYVIVQHSMNLSSNDKEEIVSAIKEILTVKKTEYKQFDLKTPNGLIVFEYIEKENIFIV